MENKPPYEMTPAALTRALVALGDLLASRALRFEIVVIGGGALALIGSLQRTTKDLDVVATLEANTLSPVREIPPALAEAARDVARVLDLGADWLNAGPASLMDLGLPPGFTDRLVAHRFGPLVVHVAARIDQIAFKLYAAVDQGPRSKHFADLQALTPTASELRGAAAWTRTHDSSAPFASELDAALRELGVKAGDGS